MIPLTQLQALSRLLDEALELPEADRLAWLERRPGIPGPVRARLRLLLAPGCSGYALPPLPPYDGMPWPAIFRYGWGPCASAQLHRLAPCPFSGADCVPTARQLRL
jgi:hypothetical protein